MRVPFFHDIKQQPEISNSSGPTIFVDEPEKNTKDDEAREKASSKLMLSFQDPVQYRKYFNDLVTKDATYERRQKESQIYSNINILWKNFTEEEATISLFISKKDAFHLKVMIGDKIKLTHPKTNSNSWTSFGIVTKSLEQGYCEVILDLPKTSAPPKELTTGFSVTFLWSGITLQRMRTAMLKFTQKEAKISEFIYKKLLGHHVEKATICKNLPKDLSVPGISSLNESQITAVKEVLRSSFSIIQGPPGTGKTAVSTSIVYHLCKRNSKPVLVCAPSNIAADQLAHRIKQCLKEERDISVTK